MKKLWIILGSIFGVLALAAGLYFLEESFTEVILHGGNNINATVKEEFVDPGFDLFHNNKLLDKDKYTYDVKSDVNTDILGKYKVNYDIKYHLRHFNIERIVNVIDDVKPVITANLEKIERDYCTKKANFPLLAFSISAVRRQMWHLCGSKADVAFLFWKVYTI